MLRIFVDQDFDHDILRGLRLHLPALDAVTALRAWLGPVSPKFIIGLQAAGAMMLLWGTLFIRGWEIQTHCGVTLVERVNRWIYRTLYCLGTAIFIFSLSLP